MSYTYIGGCFRARNRHVKGANYHICIQSQRFYFFNPFCFLNSFSVHAGCNDLSTVYQCIRNALSPMREQTSRAI